MTHTPTPWNVLHHLEWNALDGSKQPSSVFHIGDYTVVTEHPSYEFHASDRDDADFICNAVNSLETNEKRIAELEDGLRIAAATINYASYQTKVSRERAKKTLEQIRALLTPDGGK